MKRKVLVLSTMIICSITLICCGTTKSNQTDEAEHETLLQESEADTTYKYNVANGAEDYYDFEVCIWVDPETRVNYLIYKDLVYNGGADGITERLNADGTVYVSEQ